MLDRVGRITMRHTHYWIVLYQQATKGDFDTYFNSRLRDPIGMDWGNWSYIDYNHVYFSTPRGNGAFWITGF